MRPGLDSSRDLATNGVGRAELNTFRILVKFDDDRITAEAVNGITTMTT